MTVTVAPDQAEQISKDELDPRVANDSRKKAHAQEHKIDSFDQALIQANRLGYPVMMRIVTSTRRESRKIILTATDLLHELNDLYREAPPAIYLSKL